MVIRAGIPQIACQSACCNLVCAVCLGPFGRQLMSVILEHLPYCDIFFVSAPFDMFGTCWYDKLYTQT